MKRSSTTTSKSSAAQRTPTPNDFLRSERKVIRKYRTPGQVQRFLRVLPYNREIGGETLRSFRGVVQHGSAHCLEGALAAAVILEQHGYPPLVLDLESQDRLDHVLFLFRRRGLYGTVGCSRDFGLHGRRAVFRTVRQLAMSYVDPYVDGSGRVTGYVAADLRTLVRGDWRLSPRNVWEVERALVKLPHRKLATSDARYRMTLRRYRTFRRQHPDGPVDFYRDQSSWM